MDAKRAPLFPDVPTLQEAVASGWTLGAWRGVAGPKGMPQPIVDRLAASLKKVYEAREYRDFMASRGFGLLWGDARQFAEHMKQSNAAMGRTMTVVGIINR